MSSPVPQPPAPATTAQQAAQTAVGAILRTPRQRRVASAVLGIIGLLLAGVAQTVSILAGNHVIEPDPVWLQVAWQWFGLLASLGGFTWNANVR